MFFVSLSHHALSGRGGDGEGAEESSVQPQRPVRPAAVQEHHPQSDQVLISSLCSATRRCGLPARSHSSVKRGRAHICFWEPAYHPNPSPMQFKLIVTEKAGVS